MARPPSRQDAFKAHYESLDRADLARQGRQLLDGRVDQRAQRTGRWLWLILGTAGIAAVILVGLVALWLLHMAQKLGTTWGDTARQAASAYTAPEE